MVCATQESIIATLNQETEMRRNMVRITATRAMKQRTRLQDSVDMNAAVGQIKNAKPKEDMDGPRA